MQIVSRTSATTAGVLGSLALVALLAGGCRGQEGPPGADSDGAKTPAVSAEIVPVTDKTIDDVLAQHVTALGGAEKLAAVTGVRWTGAISGRGLKGLPVTVEKKRPGKYNRLIDDPEGRSVTVFNGVAGWQQGGGPEGSDVVEELPAAAVTRVKRSAEIEDALVNPTAKGRTAVLLGKQKVGDSEAFAVKVTFEDQEITYLVDVASGLLVKSLETVPTSEGPQPAEVTYQDYRDIGGVQWSFKQVYFTPGNNATQAFAWSQIEVNPALDDAMFEKPGK